MVSADNMENIVDYAYPCMMAERMLKELHKAMLDRDYDAAVEAGLAAIAEARLTVHAIRSMKEKEANRRAQ